MNILILGGTQFIGRHIAEAMLAGGHPVTVFNRGQTPDELPAGVERLRGDRDKGAAGLNALAGRRWDACVDVSGYTPRQVRPSAERLQANIGRYVYVSAVSVYGDPPERPVEESHQRQPPAGEEVTEINAETYGALKVTCENIIGQIYGDRSTVLRPQIVVGPQDPSGRFAYWIQRVSQGGPMLAPGDGSDHVQVIDVRDLARFTRQVIEQGIGGVFNLAGHRLTWTDFMNLLGARDPVWVPGEIIQAAGVTEFDLPLFRREHGPRSGLMDVNNQKALAAGLTLTDPAITVRDMQVWLHGKTPPDKLTPAQEAELITTARSLHL